MSKIIQLDDGMYVMTEPLTSAQYMVRLITPHKVQVVSRDGCPEAGSRVTNCLMRGYTFTPVLPTTPELIAALGVIFDYAETWYAQLETGVLHPKEFALVRDVLARLKDGGDGHSDQS